MTVWLLILQLTTGQTVALDVESKERCERMLTAINEGTGAVDLKVQGSLLRLPVAEKGGLACILESEFEAARAGA